MPADVKQRCGAKTRGGVPCQAPIVRGRNRCKLHGGLSTGPKTPEGKTRSMQALHAGYLQWRARNQPRKADRLRPTPTRRNCE